MSFRETESEEGEGVVEAMVIGIDPAYGRELR